MRAKEVTSLLRIAAVDAERVQLEDLAGEVFVEAALASLSGDELARTTGHCRDRPALLDGWLMARSMSAKRPKMWADRLALEASGGGANGSALGG